MKTELAKSQCLFISKPQNMDKTILKLLDNHQIQYELASDHVRAVQLAYESDYQVAVIDLDNAACPIEQTIRVLRERNPNIRVLVCTDQNSRELEMKIRKEHIYYYHVKSFGVGELNTALQSALGLVMHRGILLNEQNE